MGVDVECFLPVTPGVRQVAVRLIRRGQAVVGTGLRPVPGRAEHLTETVECLGLAGPVVQLAIPGQCLMEMVGACSWWSCRRATMPSRARAVASP